MVIIPYALSFIFLLFSGFLSSALAFIFLSPISKRLVANRFISAKTIFLIQGFVEGLMIVSIILLIFHGFKMQMTLLSFGILAIPYIFEELTRFNLSSFAPYSDIPHAKGRISGIILAVIYLLRS